MSGTNHERLPLHGVLDSVQGIHESLRAALAADAGLNLARAKAAAFQLIERITDLEARLPPEAKREAAPSDRVSDLDMLIARRQADLRHGPGRR